MGFCSSDGGPGSRNSDHYRSLLQNRITLWERRYYKIAPSAASTTPSLDPLFSPSSAHSRPEHQPAVIRSSKSLANVWSGLTCFHHLQLTLKKQHTDLVVLPQKACFTSYFSAAKWSISRSNAEQQTTSGAFQEHGIEPECRKGFRYSSNAVCGNVTATCKEEKGKWS